MSDNQLATTTPPINFDQMLLEQALQAKTADAVEILIRMAIQVRASHVAEVLEHQLQQLEKQEPRPSLPAGCVLTEHGVVIQCNGRQATQARRQLVDTGYMWHWTHLSSGTNIKIWNLPDYESPAINPTPTQWSACSTSGWC